MGFKNGGAQGKLLSENPEISDKFKKRLPILREKGEFRRINIICS